MAAVPFDWFEEVQPRDLRRWALAAAIVVGVHIGGIGGYLYQRQPDDIGDDSAVVTVDLAPDDVDQPAIPQQEEVKPPEQPPPPPPPPEETVTTVTPPPEQQPVEEQKPQPERIKSRPQTAISPTWQGALVKHLQRYKRYPAGAQERSEEGTVLLSFSVDRNGHVLAHRIERSSGHPDLDAEVTSMIERAQPLPPFPPSMSQLTLDLTVPINFSLR